MQRVCVFHRHLARVAVVWPIREKWSIIVFAGRKGEPRPQRAGGICSDKSMNRGLGWTILVVVVVVGLCLAAEQSRAQHHNHPFLTPRMPGQIMSTPVTPLLV